MDIKKKVAIGAGFVGAMAANTFITFKLTAKRQVEIDQKEMNDAFEKFLQNELPELVKAEKEAEMAAIASKDKPNIEYFNKLYEGKLFDEEPKTESKEENE